jgi:hypothetical protein
MIGLFVSHIIMSNGPERESSILPRGSLSENLLELPVSLCNLRVLYDSVVNLLVATLTTDTEDTEVAQRTTGKAVSDRLM